MKKARFTESQIVKTLKAYEAGKKAEDICRDLGINRNTFLKLGEEVQWDGCSTLKAFKRV